MGHDTTVKTEFNPVDVDDLESESGLEAEILVEFNGFHYITYEDGKYYIKFRCDPVNRSAPWEKLVIVDTKPEIINAVVAELGAPTRGGICVDKKDIPYRMFKMDSMIFDHPSSKFPTFNVALNSMLSYLQ